MDIFVEPMLPRPEIVVCGSSPVAVAIADLGRRLGFVMTACAPAAEQGAFAEVERRIEGYALPVAGEGRALHRRLDPEPRRRGGAPGGALRRRRLCRLRRQPQEGGDAEGEAPRQGRRPDAARPAEGAGRPRPRRDHAGGDRALDPRRDRHGPTETPARRGGAGMTNFPRRSVGPKPVPGRAGGDASPLGLRHGDRSRHRLRRDPAGSDRRALRRLVRRSRRPLVSTLAVMPASYAMMRRRHSRRRLQRRQRGTLRALAIAPAVGAVSVVAMLAGMFVGGWLAPDAAALFGVGSGFGPLVAGMVVGMAAATLGIAAIAHAATARAERKPAQYIMYQ